MGISPSKRTASPAARAEALTAEALTAAAPAAAPAQAKPFAEARRQEEALATAAIIRRQKAFPADQKRRREALEEEATEEATEKATEQKNNKNNEKMFNFSPQKQDLSREGAARPAGAAVVGEKPRAAAGLVGGQDRHASRRNFSMRGGRKLRRKKKSRRCPAKNCPPKNQLGGRKKSRRKSNKKRRKSRRHKR